MVWTSNLYNCVRISNNMFIFFLTAFFSLRAILKRNDMYLAGIDIFSKIFFSLFIPFFLWAFVALALLFLLIILIAVGQNLILHITPKGRRIKRLIDSMPGPPAIPILGNAVDVWVSRERIMEVRHEFCCKYSPIYRLWFFHFHIVEPVAPECLESLLRSSKHTDKSRIYKILHPWLGSGLLTSSGEKWSARRKLLTPAFHFKILEEFIPMFIERSSAFVKKLAVESMTGKAFDVVPLISQCTLDIICESAMGIKLDRENEEQRKYIAAIYTFGEIGYQRVINPLYHADWIFALTPMAVTHRRLLKTLHSFTEKVIKEKKLEYLQSKSAGKSEDNGEENKSKGKKVKAFLELLIELSLESNLLTDKEIREEVDTFMFEGHDTTSMAICWTILMLANNPKIQDDVWHEIETLQRAAGGDCDESKSKDFGEMHLLERCIKESLRLYPSVPFISREITQDLQMGNCLVPSGAIINVFISGIHRNPEIFPNPDTFDPNRFLPEAVKERHPYAYIPFSAGPRNCIGQRFAMLEMKAVLSALISKYRIIAVDKPENVKTMLDLVLRCTTGIRIKVEPR